LSTSKEQAWREVADGLKQWQNDYIVGILGTPKRKPFADGYEAAFLAHTTSDAEAPLLRRFAFRVVARETIDLGDRGKVDCHVVRVDAATPWTFWISTTRRPAPVLKLKIEARDGVVWWWKPPVSREAS